ncbi:transcriptional regulator, DeoR family [Alicyclobacillus acidocaldarius subsp. acidocaldarius Tc-4-1]|uniref:Transcriptional regulator, DeoR family n=1 Tax=Alicyclobacillus acidocaldarius (strain Tc-4-1) TaxID=1048834 RepID=F8II19_ALIAT|nr:transcriptional regulator, DeoR family [Alicyclobacillus acidocaldarius subsp. acidocaldarius Tc-4-1]
MIKGREVRGVYPKERQRVLLELLAQHGFASYRQLAEKLGVSEITVRRDMKALEAQGLVETAFGGGQVARAARELPYTDKRVLQIPEKMAIAKAALRQIESGMTIAIAAGTTTWVLAQHIAGFQKLTFLTNSVNVATELSKNGYSDIFLTGGQFRTPSDALVGPVAEQMIRQFRADILFVGASGLHVDHGLSTPNVLEAAVNRAMMERAARVVVLADHTKWGVESLMSFAKLNEIDALITDRWPGEAEATALADCDVELIVADAPNAESSHRGDAQ